MNLRKIAGKLLEYSACLHITMMMTLFNFSCIIVFFILLFTSWSYISLFYLVWYLYDRKTPFQAGRHSSTLRNLFLWKYLARYFPIKLHKTVDLDPTKNYIFAFHPHGLFVFGGFVNFCTNATGFDEMFPGLTMHMIVLNGQFQFPFYRDYLISAGFGSANPESVDYKLTKIGPGHSVWIAIGGAAEVMLVEPSCYTLKLNKRKGFVRRALKTGALVVPVFSFNEHRLYDISLPEKGTVGYYVQQFAKFISNIELPVSIRGRSYMWFFLPRRNPINTVVGEPIDFGKLKSFEIGEEPSDELVDECHLIYVDTLRKLYDDNKARFGDAETPLVLI